MCRGKFAQAYTDAPYRKWQDEAKALLDAHRPYDPTTPHTGDVEIDVEVIVQRPKKTVKVRPSGDADNYLKGVYDAITSTKGYWHDDDQVVGGSFRKRWARPDETPGYNLRINFLHEGT